MLFVEEEGKVRETLLGGRGSRTAITSGGPTACRGGRRRRRRVGRLAASCGCGTTATCRRTSVIC